MHSQLEIRREGSVKEVGVFELAGLLFEQVLGLDLPERCFNLGKFERVVIGRFSQEFDLHDVGINRNPANLAEDPQRLVVATLVDEPTWGEGHEEDADAENGGGDELERQRDTPCSFALALSGSADEVGAVVDPEGDHDPEGYSQLL